MIETLGGGRYGDAVSDAPAFPQRDPVGPAFSGIDTAARRVITDVVAPHAAEADSSGVRRSTIDALASAGLLGSPLTPDAAQRELAELIAGSDASTWFCWVQHFTPLRILEASSPSHELLPGLRSGGSLAAVAFAHVRRPGPPNPVATRTAEGWRLDGTLDWVTSWDIADTVMVMAQGSGDDAGSFVCCFLPAGRSSQQLPGIEVGPPLELLAMGGTYTRPVRLNGVTVPGELVGAVLDRAEWLDKDLRTSAGVNPAVFGIARGALAELDALGEQRSDEAIVMTARVLVEECRSLRRLSYDALDDPGTPIAQHLALRARALDFLMRATTAVIVARAGAAMRSGQSAERRVREALFMQVQAQTAASRRASLGLLTTRS